MRTALIEYSRVCVVVSK